MPFKIKVAALAVASVFPFSVSAQTSETPLDPVLVTATGVEMADVDAPYASEVHTRRDIERSGAATLVEYL
jgi:iron complex outermembrane recepter protein